jgi:hypothetical protein
MFDCPRPRQTREPLFQLRHGERKRKAGLHVSPFFSSLSLSLSLSLLSGKTRTRPRPPPLRVVLRLVVPCSATIARFPRSFVLGLQPSMRATCLWLVVSSPDDASGLVSHAQPCLFVSASTFFPAHGNVEMSIRPGIGIPRFSTSAPVICSCTRELAMLRTVNVTKGSSCVAVSDAGHWHSVLS